MVFKPFCKNILVYSKTYKEIIREYEWFDEIR